MQSYSTIITVIGYDNNNIMLERLDIFDSTIQKVRSLNAAGNSGDHLIFIKSVGSGKLPVKQWKKESRENDNILC